MAKKLKSEKDKSKKYSNLRIVTCEEVKADDFINQHSK